MTLQTIGRCFCYTSQKHILMCGMIDQPSPAVHYPSKILFPQFKRNYIFVYKRIKTHNKTNVTFSCKTLPAIAPPKTSPLLPKRHQHYKNQPAFNITPIKRLYLEKPWNIILKCLNIKIWTII